MKLKARYKLIPAIAMLAVSAVVLSSASFAWFTMSKDVTATGINLTAVAPNNLLIAQAQDINGTAPVNGNYAETVDLQKLNGKLKPSSTLDAIALYQVEKGLGTNGIPKEGNTIEAVTMDGTQSLKWKATNDANSIGYYADFDLWLKTTGESDIAVKINPDENVTKIVAGGVVGKEIYKSVRFAILDGDTANTAFTGNNYIWKGETTFNTPVLGPLNDKTTWQGTAEKDAVTDPVASPKVGNLIDGNAIFTVTPAAAKKITVRVWIEGQSATCLNTNAAGDFKLTIGFMAV